MKFKRLFIALGLGCSFATFSQEPLFSKIDIKPNPNGNGSHTFIREFIGNGQRIRIIFTNDQEGPEHTIKIFPEPPITLRNNQTNTVCHINEGGIWARDQVYLSQDEHYLLLSEYSGSSEDLVSYNTGTCERFQRLDVSGLDWVIDGNQVHFQPFNMNFFVLPIH